MDPRKKDLLLQAIQKAQISVQANNVPAKQAIAFARIEIENNRHRQERTKWEE